jgi:hypothetical protein
MAIPAGHPVLHGADRSVLIGRTLRQLPVLRAVVVEASEIGISG